MIHREQDDRIILHNDQLKNISQIEHTRHRSAKIFIVNLIAGLIAYTHQPLNPVIKLSSNELQALATIS